MKHIFRRLFLSISFLTILPINFLFLKKEQGNQDYIKEDLSKSSIFFPLVGILIGLILVAVDILLKWVSFDSSLSNGIILAVWIFLSGGLHLEGFADMVDGFSGGKTQEEIIGIMKDGAVGAKGAIALILLILLKFLLINSLPDTFKKEALLMAPVIGRWAMVLTGYWGEPASSNNILTKYFTLYLGKKELLIATFIAICFTFFIVSYPCIYLFLLTGLVTRGMLFYAYHKIQGICGDLIGAINEVNEVVVLLLFSLPFMPF